MLDDEDEIQTQKRLKISEVNKNNAFIYVK